MRRDPFWISCRTEIDRLFDTLVHAAWGTGPSLGGWNPPVDVVEETDRYRVEMDLPGLSSSDLSITAEGGVLRISGTRERTRRGPMERPHVTERPVGRFVRTFRLPSDADPDRIRARLRDGVLVIEVLKRPPTGRSR